MGSGSRPKGGAVGVDHRGGLAGGGIFQPDDHSPAGRGLVVKCWSCRGPMRVESDDGGARPDEEKK